MSGCTNSPTTTSMAVSPEKQAYTHILCTGVEHLTQPAFGIPRPSIKLHGVHMTFISLLCDPLCSNHASAMQVDNAGIDILLVGDSVAMVVHGHDTTLPVTLDDMIVHCKAVYRGARRYGNTTVSVN